MANLCKAARGRECQVRIPGVCNGKSETSVLAHIRLTAAAMSRPSSPTVTSP